MKKWIAFMLILVLGVVLYGCTTEEDPGKNPGTKDDDITGITITGNLNDLNVGETVTLSAAIAPATADQTIVWSSKNTAVATVDENTGVVTGVSAGVVEIVATSKISNKITRSVSIKIVQPIVYDDPTSVEIKAQRLEFNKGTFITLKAEVYPLANEDEGTDGANQEVMWSSSDTNIATVDDKGRVTGKEVGTVTITAVVVADTSLTTTIELLVKEQVIGPAPTEPTELQVRGETEVEEGYEIALLATVLPSGVSQNVRWSSGDETIATVNARGIVTALKAGKTYILAESAANTKISRLYEITVMPKVVMPTRTDMGGYVLEIMAAPHALHEHDPKLDKYTGTDKTAKLEAWANVEHNFNITMKVIPFPETAPWGGQRVSWIIDKANLGLAETDIFVSTTDWLIDFATANATVDVTPYYNQFGKNSMSPAVRMASSYQGGMYSMPTGTFGAIQPYHGIFFNVNLVRNKGLENPAELFNRGEWTWPNFKTYVTEAAAELAEDETVLSGKEAGLFYGMVNAAGVSLVDPVLMELNFDHPHAVAAASLIQDIYKIDNMWGTSAWDQFNTTFMEGKSLMATSEYWFLKDSGRFPENMWGEGTATQYGYVPFPYPETMDKDATRVSYQGGAIYQMTSGREYNHNAGMGYADVYRAFTELMLETTAAMKADPEVDEDLNMRNAAAFKLDDAASIEAITFFKGDKVIYDPFYAIQPSWSHAGPMIDKVAAGEDYTSVYSAVYADFLKALQDQFGTI